MGGLPERLEAGLSQLHARRSHHARRGSTQAHDISGAPFLRYAATAGDHDCNATPWFEHVSATGCATCLRRKGCRTAGSTRICNFGRYLSFGLVKNNRTLKPYKGVSHSFHWRLEWRNIRPLVFSQARQKVRFLTAFSGSRFFYFNKEDSTRKGFTSFLLPGVSYK